ncbi:corticotropin-releasing factor receptor 2-like isoform X2 [Biomphalaria glabrata]|uniref:Corticotropin-releasing factor receptor 2-like isoform X2 n=1 Tax=Biomphalaria glabrata TaxID=6526 RepID=A0A9W2YCM7_BIOGL|nr:corticotropin-releasing factor receptor 2-like isoform X2 [Biomphalaria glabrata]KAI8789543.1 corticotropin-releasing factor receptor 2 [Biomphalaria glabrata]
MDYIRHFFPNFQYEPQKTCNSDTPLSVLLHLSEPDVLYCNSTSDTFTCWPATSAGAVAQERCPEHSVVDQTANVTKLCRDNGTWETANYSACMPNTTHSMETHKTSTSPEAWILYDIGFTITTIALLVALTIFLNFKSLRCLRNIIHCNLMVALLVTNVKWLILRLASFSLASAPPVLCKILVTILTYFHSAIFFWMFVEGLYLFTIVIWAYSVHKIRLWHYILIGWGIPFVFVIIWVCVRSQYKDMLCWLPEDGTNYVDYIIHVPALTVLGINVFFITVIIWTLVTKLRASNTIETRQSRKALKAIVVLLPLLGVTYILLLVPPVRHETLERIYYVLSVTLQSLQGLFVAIFYCFLNGEVQTVLRQKFSALQDSRTFGRYTMSSFFTARRRSSCYAMTSTTCNGKAGSPKQSVVSKYSRAGEGDKEAMETEASAAMMDNVL